MAKGKDKPRRRSKKKERRDSFGKKGQKGTVKPPSRKKESKDKA